MKTVSMFIFRVLCAAFALAMIIPLTGCEATNIGVHSGDASDEYSNQAWNRQEPWEGGKGFGGFQGNQ